MRLIDLCVLDVPTRCAAECRLQTPAAPVCFVVFWTAVGHSYIAEAWRRDQPTLRGINLTIERGEFCFVTGPSGAGKSTLLQLVYRKHTVDAGRILFCGRDIARLRDDSIPFLRRNLGIVFQDFKIVKHWSVFENVAVALEILDMPQRLIRARVSEALERVGLAGRGRDRTENLSGGEQQRVAVARAIVTEPALILADEPTGNLDPHLAIDILTLFEEINETGTTVLFATHDHSLMAKRDHRIIGLDDGRVLEARRGLRSWGGDGASDIDVDEPRGLHAVPGSAG
jgi:cell division transport system ATP-binding protein